MCVEHEVLGVLLETGFCLVVVMVVGWPVAAFFVVVVVVAVVVVAVRVQMANLDPCL